VHDVTVSGSDLSVAGDDNLAVWSAGDKATQIVFKDNKVSQMYTTNPVTTWGNCVAIYGGSHIEVHNTDCYSTNDGVVKISSEFGGSFGDRTHIVVQGSKVHTGTDETGIQDGGKPDCFFAEGRTMDTVGCDAKPGTVQNFFSGKCIDVPGGAASNGQLLWQWECNGYASQNFYLEGSALVYGSDPTYCVDATDVGAKGHQIELWTCNGLPQQSFGYDTQMQAIYLSESMDDASLCLDVFGSSLDNGGIILTWDCLGTSAANQRWTLGSRSTEAAII